MDSTETIYWDAQVVIGFAASAWLTVLILVAYYIFAFDPRADPFDGTDSRSGKQAKTPHTPNPMDLLLFRYAEYLRKWQNHTGNSIENAFHKVFSVVVSAIWGTLSIKELRALGAPDMREDDENDWTFGQVMPLALLVSSLLPIFNLFIKFYFTYKHKKTTSSSCDLPSH
ncbi:hypothetical protein CTA2_9485 [Colletotrichum tanaceti]|uniref:Uncharacterized protein n=1 Tax=Colletotrichum tanaceti TaxID=1306861 RepID=A0A4U6XTI0_9PEZI|nr:hypothetical protein CTA2_9485 [Colletotrichum tanaceti]TKW59171.1 hypothetical protein CTA1_878 [Colletotrichum tanaceti]